MNIRTFVTILSRNPQYNFPKMRGGVKGRLELFRKFIRFGNVLRPLVTPDLVKSSSFVSVEATSEISNVYRNVSSAHGVFTLTAWMIGGALPWTSSCARPATPLRWSRAAAVREMSWGRNNLASEEVSYLLQNYVFRFVKSLSLKVLTIPVLYRVSIMCLQRTLVCILNLSCDPVQLLVCYQCEHHHNQNI